MPYVCIYFAEGKAVEKFEGLYYPIKNVYENPL